jgi:hypothetical protein
MICSIKNQWLMTISYQTIHYVPADKTVTASY